MVLKKEKIIVKDTSVSCSGHEYPYDHPIVYLEINADTKQVECPYCSKIFVIT